MPRSDTPEYLMVASVRHGYAAAPGFRLRPCPLESNDGAAPERSIWEEERTVTDPTAGAREASGAPSPELQFEHAERAGPTAGTACAVCKHPITTSYFEINGKVTCERCRGRILSVWNRGSAAHRGAKAFGLGALAAALGAAVYFGIAALTGYEFGLIAVLVGLAVGIAVRKGSGGRGGWRHHPPPLVLPHNAAVPPPPGPDPPRPPHALPGPGAPPHAPRGPRSSAPR